ncbi:MAG: PASTA domain-containing protein, partial [Oscillospiraceae bacterium]|nr:PASTA domain-containing protein [Oscillospiraceae bacterium]
QNIMVLPNGHIKVTDFGIARFARSETRTMTDKAIGSVHYIAPEQARGDLTDEKADIYSVGVMLYEMTTGQLPFEAENAVSVAIMQLQTDPCPPRQINPDIPIGLQEITLKAMQKDPMQRYQSASEMLRDIEIFQQDPSTRFNYQYYPSEHSTKYIDSESTAEIDPQNGYGDDYVYTENGEVKPQPDKEEKNTKKAPLIAAAIAAAFLVVALILALTGVFNSQKKVTLEDFVGKTLASVEANNPNSYQFSIQYIADGTKNAGMITAQNPTAGTTVATGSKVTLTVVKSDDSAIVPDISNQSKSAAEQTLKESGLLASFKDQSSDTVEKGNAISTDPPAGTSLEKGKSVTVYISTGPGELSIPNVTGQTLEQATATLTNAGFKVTATAQDNTGREANYVVSTAPSAGSSAKKGDTVTIFYSSGKNDKEIRVVVQLPANVNHSMSLVYFIDGERKGDATVNPASNNTWTGQFKDSNGTKELLIALDGQNYVKYKLDFNTGNWTTSWQGTYKDAQASSASSAASSKPVSSAPASTPSNSNPAPSSAVSSEPNEG